MSSPSGSPSLRRLEPSDATTLAAWSLDQEFCAAAGWSTDLPFGDHIRFHSRIVTEPPAELIRLGLVHDGHLIGYVDLHGLEERRGELGFVIAPGCWGRGFGTAAARLGIEHGFALGLHEIWAEALDANVASIRILQRVGMVETGRGDDDTYLGVPSFYRQFTIA